MIGRSLRTLLLCVLCGCSDTTPEIKFGGSGPGRAAAAPGDAAGLYNEAYARLVKPNAVIREELKQNSYNRVAIREAIHQILESLRTMESLIQPPYCEKLNESIKEYESFERDVRTGNLPPGAAAVAERLERTVRLNFAPSRNLPLQLKPPEVEPVRGPVVTTGGQRAPAGQPAASGGTAPAKPPPDAASAPAGTSGATTETPYWVLFDAWKQSHGDLAEAYTSRKGDYPARYKKLRDSLALVRARLPEADQPKIDIYLKEYQRIHESTEGFIKLPSGQTEAQVRAQIDGVGRAIELTYSPDAVEKSAPK